MSGEQQHSSATVEKNQAAASKRQWRGSSIVRGAHGVMSQGSVTMQEVHMQRRPEPGGGPKGWAFEGQQSLTMAEGPRRWREGQDDGERAKTMAKGPR